MVWFMPVIPAHECLRQEDQEFQAGLGYIVKSGVPLATQQNTTSKRKEKIKFVCTCSEQSKNEQNIPYKIISKEILERSVMFII